MKSDSVFFPHNTVFPIQTLYFTYKHCISHSNTISHTNTILPIQTLYCPYKHCIAHSNTVFPIQTLYFSFKHCISHTNTVLSIRTLYFLYKHCGGRFLECAIIYAYNGFDFTSIFTTTTKMAATTVPKKDTEEVSKPSLDT